MTFSLHKLASRLFLFDVPRRLRLTSGTKMRRHSAPAPPLNAVSHVVAAMVLLAVCHSAWALPRHEKSEIHKEIEALEQQWRQAIVTNNVSEMGRLLADDYIGITSNGTVETKTQAVDQSRAGTMRITKLDITDTHVRVYGDTAVVTSLADLVGTTREPLTRALSSLRRAGLVGVTGDGRYSVPEPRKLAGLCSND